MSARLSPLSLSGDVRLRFGRRRGPICWASRGVVSPALSSPLQFGARRGRLHRAPKAKLVRRRRAHRAQPVRLPPQDDLLLSRWVTRSSVSSNAPASCRAALGLPGVPSSSPRLASSLRPWPSTRSFRHCSGCCVDPCAAAARGTLAGSSRQPRPLGNTSLRPPKSGIRTHRRRFPCADAQSAARVRLSLGCSYGFGGQIMVQPARQPHQGACA